MESETQSSRPYLAKPAGGGLFATQTMDHVVTADGRGVVCRRLHPFREVLPVVVLPNFSNGISAYRTGEIGLTSKTERPCRSFACLLEESSEEDTS